jgi:N-methylhydantoinase B
MESAFPLRYMFRRRMIDSGGPGKYRGGLGMELALTPHDAPDGGLHYVVSGKGINFSMSEGLAGGYAGAPNSYVWVHNNESPEGSNVDASFALGLDEMAGRQEPISWGVFPLMGKDALYVRWNGGGGYGDPLDREPEAVLSDCRAGLVTRAVARDVYGVVMSDDMGAIDAAATERARQSLAAARGARRAAE